MNSIQLCLNLPPPEDVVWFGWVKNTPAKILNTGKGFRLILLPPNRRILAATPMHRVWLGHMRPPPPPQARDYLLKVKVLEV